MVLVGFGVAKSVMSFQSKAIVSNTFDLVLGVIWALMYVYLAPIQYVYPGL